MNSVRPEAWRRGVDIAMLSHYRLVWGGFLAQPGEEQTVSTAELFVVLLIVALTLPRANILVVVDLEYS